MPPVTRRATLKQLLVDDLAPYQASVVRLNNLELTGALTVPGSATTTIGNAIVGSLQATSATVQTLSYTGTQLTSDCQVWVPYTSFVAVGGAVWTPQQVDAGAGTALTKEPGVDSSLLVADVTNELRTAAQKSCRLVSVTPAYRTFGDALTLATVNAYGRTFAAASPPTVAQLTISPNTLPLTGQSADIQYATRVNTAPAAVAPNTIFTVVLRFDAQANTNLQFYGAMVQYARPLL